MRNFESPSSSEREIRDFNGDEYETLFLAVMSVGWSSETYLDARRREEDERASFGKYTDQVIERWFEDHVDSGLPTFEQWKREPSAKKREILLEWLADRQPQEQEPLGEKLHHLVALALGLQEDGENELKICSAAHSPADTLYGVDGFFKFNGQVVTFDLTANVEKFGSGVRADKADEIIACLPTDEECLRRAAKNIAHVLKFKIKRVEAEKNSGRQGPTARDLEERKQRLAGGWKRRPLV